MLTAITSDGGGPSHHKIAIGRIKHGYRYPQETIPASLLSIAFPIMGATPKYRVVRMA